MTVFAVLGLCLGLSAADAPKASTRRPLRYECLGTFHFDESQRSIFLPVNALGSTQAWIFDTGASVHLLPTEQREKLGPVLSLEKGKGAFEKLEFPLFAPPKDLKLGEVPLSGPVSVMDVRRFRELAGRPIGGVVGASLLLKQMVVINFDAGELDVAVPPGGGTAQDRAVVERGIGHVPELDVLLPDGKTEKFILDSGADGWINLSAGTFDRLAATGFITEIKAHLTTTIEGRQQETKQGTLSEFTVGERKFERLQATRLAGNGLGFQLMRQWNWIFNIPDGTMSMHERRDTPPVKDIEVKPTR